MSAPPGTVKETGAIPGDVLIGVQSDANIGLAIEISAAQPKGEGGRIQGAFKVLSAGKGCYADGISVLLEEQHAFQTAASFLLRLQQIPFCEAATHIVNANALRRADSVEAQALRNRSRWQERSVDRACEHFEVRYGSVKDGGWNDWLPAALVGPPVNGVFSVQFLVDRSRADRHDVVEKVIKEIEFYILELNEPDPWRYLQYHCGAAANTYSDVHWSFSRGDSESP